MVLLKALEQSGSTSGEGLTFFQKHCQILKCSLSYWQPETIIKKLHLIKRLIFNEGLSSILHSGLWTYYKKILASCLKTKESVRLSIWLSQVLHCSIRAQWRCIRRQCLVRCNYLPVLLCDVLHQAWNFNECNFGLETWNCAGPQTHNSSPSFLCDYLHPCILLLFLVHTNTN